MSLVDMIQCVDLLRNVSSFYLRSSIYYKINNDTNATVEHIFFIICKETFK